jgi:hypothetical protein
MICRGRALGPRRPGMCLPKAQLTLWMPQGMTKVSSQCQGKEKMLPAANLDDVESLDIDKFVFGLRVALIAGAKIVIDKGAEDDLGAFTPISVVRGMVRRS